MLYVSCCDLSNCVTDYLLLVVVSCAHMCCAYYAARHVISAADYSRQLRALLASVLGAPHAYISSSLLENLRALRIENLRAFRGSAVRLSLRLRACAVLAVIFANAATSGKYCGRARVSCALFVDGEHVRLAHCSGLPLEALSMLGESAVTASVKVGALAVVATAIGAVVGDAIASTMIRVYIIVAIALCDCIWIVEGPVIVSDGLGGGFSKICARTPASILLHLPYVSLGFQRAQILLVPTVALTFLPLSIVLSFCLEASAPLQE
eukprot:IDg16985t1